MNWVPWLVIVAAIVQASCHDTRPNYAQFLNPCPIAEPRERTLAEAVRVATARREALIQCNKDKERLRELLTH